LGSVGARIETACVRWDAHVGGFVLVMVVNLLRVRLRVAVRIRSAVRKIV
jgi:hypothetical protein